MAESLSEGEFSIEVENIGGIDRTTASFRPGVTILAGQNATNRTSLLQALIAGLGGSNVSLKGDAESGHVELTVGEQTYTRHLTRTDGSLTFDGDPYLDDPIEADLFAFLLESNESRRAVVQESDLREIIMRPIDTAEIEAEIEERVATRRELESRLSELEDLAPRLTQLEERKRELTAEIRAKREEVESVRQQIERADADVDESKTQKRRREETLDDLKSTQTELESVRRQIASEQESIEALEDELEELTAKLDGLEVPEENVDQLDREIESLRSRKRSIESSVSRIQKIIQFNDEMVAEEGTLPDQLTAGTSTGDATQRESVTDQLVEDTKTTCWTCGSTVDTDQIVEMVDELRSVHTDLVNDRSELSARISDLRKRKTEISDRREQKERYEQRIEQTESEIRDRERTLEDLEADRERLAEEVTELERRIDELETEEYEETLSLQRELSTLEFELSNLEQERTDVASEIDEVEARLDERPDVEDRLDDVRETIADLRTRVETIERQAVAEFNDQMESILGVLEYENIDRIWIERVQRDVREGRRKVETTLFELHIVRQSDDGVTYEDTIHHLSESEREVTGLVFALAGYLVHDLYDELPFMVLDSVEALDSHRIAALVDYFSEYVDYLVVALLPEDSAALDDSYRRIREI